MPGTIKLHEGALGGDRLCVEHFRRVCSHAEITWGTRDSGDVQVIEQLQALVPDLVAGPKEGGLDSSLSDSPWANLDARVANYRQLVDSIA